MGCGASKSADRQVGEPETTIKNVTQDGKESKDIKRIASANSSQTTSIDQGMSLHAPSHDSSTKSNLPYHEYRYTTADSKVNYESPTDYRPSALIQSQVSQNERYAIQQQQTGFDESDDPHMAGILLQQQKELELYEQQKQQKQAHEQHNKTEHSAGKSSKSSGRLTDANQTRRSTTFTPGGSSHQRSTTPTPGGSSHQRSTTPTVDRTIHRAATHDSVLTSPHHPALIPPAAGGSKTYIGVFEGMNVLSRDEFVSKYTGEKMFRWRKAEITYVDGEDRSKVLVHYTGWADTFDYWVDLEKDWERLAPPQLLSKDQCNKGTALDSEQSHATKEYFLNSRLPLTRKNSDSSITRLSKENATMSSGDTRFNYVLGQKLDILDIFYKRGADTPSYKWRSAEIVDMSGLLITIHFENWDSKYDETLHIVQDAKRISAAGTRVKNSHNSDNRSVNTNNSTKSRQLYRSSDVYSTNDMSNLNLDALSFDDCGADAASFHENELRMSAEHSTPGHSRSKSFNGHDAPKGYDEPPPPYSPVKPSGHGLSIAAAIGAPTVTQAVSRSSSRTSQRLTGRALNATSTEAELTFGSNSRDHYASYRDRRPGGGAHVRQKSDGELLLSPSKSPHGRSAKQMPQQSQLVPLRVDSQKVTPSRKVKRVLSNSKMSDLNVPVLNDVTYESDADQSQNSRNSRGSRGSRGSKGSGGSGASPTKRLHNTGSLQSMSSPDILEAALADVLADGSGEKEKTGMQKAKSFSLPSPDMPGIDIAAYGAPDTFEQGAKPLKSKRSFLPEVGEHTSEQPSTNNIQVKKKWSFTWASKDPERDVPAEESKIARTFSEADVVLKTKTKNAGSHARLLSLSARAPNEKSEPLADVADTLAGPPSPSTRSVTMLVTHQKNPGSTALVKDDIDASRLPANDKDGLKLGDRMVRQFSMLSWSRIFRTVSGGPGDGALSVANDSSQGKGVIPSASHSAKELGDSKADSADSTDSDAEAGPILKTDSEIRNFELEIGGENIADEDVDPEGARKAEEEAIRERYFLERLEEKGLHVFEIEGDGNCLFRAVSHQLYLDQDMHEELRSRCVDHLVKNRKRFEDFCGGDFDEHVKQMRLLGTWGDDLEIRVLEEICDRSILIYSSDVEKVDEPINNNPEELALLRGAAPIKLSYHGQSHYNSIYDEQYRLPLSNRTTRTLQRARLALYKGEGGKVPSRTRRPRSASRGAQSLSTNPASMAAYQYGYPTPTQTTPQRPYYMPMAPESKGKEYRK